MLFASDEELANDEGPGNELGFGKGGRRSGGDMAWFGGMSRGETAGIPVYGGRSPVMQSLRGEGKRVVLPGIRWWRGGGTGCLGRVSARKRWVRHCLAVSLSAGSYRSKSSMHSIRDLGTASVKYLDSGWG